MASPGVPSKGASPPTSSITSPIPTHHGTRQQDQEKNSDTIAAASKPETLSKKSEIVGISKPGVNTKSASGDLASQTDPRSSNDPLAVESPIGDLKDKQPGKNHEGYQETEKAHIKGPEEDRKDGSSTKSESLTNPQVSTGAMIFSSFSLS
jgi:hypothetical protein